MTKAVFLDEHGGPDAFALRDQTLADPGPGEIRVRHKAVGLNFIDIYQRKGLYPVSLPAVLGQEAAGVVEAVGEGVSDFAPGERVACLYGVGGYAEEGNAPAALSAKIPDGVSDDAAAALFLKGLTAEMLVRQLYPLKAGKTCLVHAAAGGVGTILCQWAKHIGARVIAVVGSPEKEAIARENGADEVVIRTQTESIAAEVRRLTGGEGVEVVYDSIGEATFEASLDSLALRGHMVTYGNASGPPPAVTPLELMRRGSLTLTRPSLFHYATPERLPAMAAALFEMVASGAVKPKIAHRLALSDIADAHRLLESGKTAGAIILTP
ncbi:quinone oxidoreductase family protein [Hyphococcus luteus]|uniref:Quinone oxidoreductase n=1 Tax=Hyphococcus luteus TaxID=2058213 RepID=A0A2S7K6P9_9PROT|nr:quinone oxidoreductase [Marinicaulis flavus]PQA88190.1 quinone oxidoreductase [Marinicaulis flavus]